MHFFEQIVLNHSLWTAVLGFLVAQLLKVVFVLLTQRRVDFGRLIGAGGMPSSHASFVTSLGTFVGLEQGFDSALFAVCAVMACIVMYDASGVRRAAGKQAALLNQIIEHWNEEPKLQGERLKELIGHTPFEVIAGAALGIVLAIVMFYLVF